MFRARDWKLKISAMGFLFRYELWWKGRKTHQICRQFHMESISSVFICQTSVIFKNASGPRTQTHSHTHIENTKKVNKINKWRAAKKIRYTTLVYPLKKIRAKKEIIYEMAKQNSGEWRVEKQHRYEILPIRNETENKSIVSTNAQSEWERER